MVDSYNLSLILKGNYETENILIWKTHSDFSAQLFPVAVPTTITGASWVFALWYFFWSTYHILVLNMKYSYSTNKVMKNCTFVKNVKRFPDLRCAFMVGLRGVFMQPYLHLRFFYGCTSFPMHISKGNVIWVLHYLKWTLCPKKDLSFKFKMICNNVIIINNLNSHLSFTLKGFLLLFPQNMRVKQCQQDITLIQRCFLWGVWVEILTTAY